MHYFFTHGLLRFSLRLMIPVFLLFFSTRVNSQEKAAFDSSFYQTYPRLITARVFFSQKYTSLQLEAPKTSPKFIYRPNTSRNIGIGATYKAITLNLGLGVFNNDKRGKTRSLDLQSHVYTRKWIGDILGQFYKGYYLAPRGYAASQPGSYYIRPDVRVNLIGLAAYRLLNAEKFSYRAAFLQNEWQKKSAGTFLLGAEVYHGIIRGDSALIPVALNDLYTQKGIDKVRFLEIGPGLGYAYTAVYKKNYFLTGSLSANADLSFVKEYTGNISKDKFGISPNLIFRAVAGYNSDSWSVNVSWFTNSITVNGVSSRDKYFVRTGNYRLTLAKRIMPGFRLKKKLKIIDAIN